MCALRAVIKMNVEERTMKKAKQKNREKAKEAGSVLLFAVGVNAPFFAHIWGLI